MKCPNPACAIDAMLEELEGCGCGGNCCIELYQCNGCGTTFKWLSWIDQIAELQIPAGYKGHGQ